MDRYAVLVDAGYLLSGMGFVTTGSSDRATFDIEIDEMLDLLHARAKGHCGLDLLRLYWYDAATERRLTPMHKNLAEHDNVKVRLGRLGMGGQKGVDALLLRDFLTLAQNKAVDTSRKAYLTSLSISSYSLTAMLRALQPLMENRPEGAAAVALSYPGGERVVPHYGGGMSTAKAALQIDAKQLASNLGPKNIRVNIISAGPYASRAASAIGDIDHMIQHAAAGSPMPRGITAEEVANSAAFLCSPLASAITGHVLYVDCGYNVMGIFPK